jgi:hypothetical protein
LKINATIELDLLDPIDDRDYMDFRNIAKIRGVLHRNLDRLNNELSGLKKIGGEEAEAKAAYLMSFYTPFIDDCLEVGIS